MPETPAMTDLKRQADERQAHQIDSWLSFRNRLRADPGVLVCDVAADLATHVEDLRNLTEWLGHSTQGSLSDATKSWQRLEPAFGREVALGYADAMRQLWRHVEPQRPSREPGQPVRSSWHNELAFAALTIEASSNEDWARGLSDAEARRATEYLG